MPRDSSGVYTLPPGNPVVTNTLIASTWANPTMSDIAAQLNNVLTRDGLLGPTGQFKLQDGTVAAPGLAFASEVGLGWYREGAGKLAVASAGAKVLGLDASVPGTLTLGNAGILQFNGPVYGVTEPNLLVNSTLSINQRGAALSDSVGNAVYFFDMWRGGAAGGTYTVAVLAGTGGVNQCTVSAGSVNQVVPAVNMEGGDYVLSWSGTALGSINGGTPAVSPVRATLAGNALAIVNFQGGVFSKPKFERGKNPTPWVKPKLPEEFLGCLPYYTTFNVTTGAYGTGANSIAFTVPIAVPLFNSAPIITNAATGAGSGVMGVQNGATLFFGNIVANSLSLWSTSPGAIGLSAPFGGAGSAMPSTISVFGALNCSP